MFFALNLRLFGVVCKFWLGNVADFFWLGGWEGLNRRGSEVEGGWLGGGDLWRKAFRKQTGMRG